MQADAVDCHFLEAEFGGVVQQFVQRGGVESGIGEGAARAEEAELELEVGVASQPWLQKSCKFPLDKIVEEHLRYSVLGIAVEAWSESAMEVP